MAKVGKADLPPRATPTSRASGSASASTPTAAADPRKGVTVSSYLWYYEMPPLGAAAAAAALVPARPALPTRTAEAEAPPPSTLVTFVSSERQGPLKGLP